MFYYGCDYYPEHWPETRWETDAHLMQEAGFNVARIGEFAWALMEPDKGHYNWSWLDRAIDTLSRHGIQVVLGTPTATPPPWLTTAHPEILPRDRNRQVRHAGSRRHYCPNSPTYREHSRRIVMDMAKRYGHDQRVVGWQLDNEFGCHETGRCYCDVCAHRFREWLQRRYGTIEALNRAWGSVFWSAVYADWEEIPPPWAAPTEHNPAHELDFRRFGSDSILEYEQVQVDVLREMAPDQFLTHNFMTFHSRELDYYDIAAPLDLAAWDNYHFYGATPTVVAATHDLYRGMKSRGHWVIEQQVSNVNWAGYNPTLRPGEVGLKVWQSIAHGADGIVYFRWRAACFGAELYHSGLLDHAAQPTRGYAEAKGIGQQLGSLGRALEGSAPQAQVAFLHDYVSRWSLDLQPHNKDLADDMAFERGLMAPYEALWTRGVPVDILPARGAQDLASYRMVILPTLNLVSRNLAARLAGYVQGGGTLVVTARSGFKDELGQAPGRPPGHLSDLLGVTVAEFDSLPPDRPNKVRLIDGHDGQVQVTHWCEVLATEDARPMARPLAMYESDYYAGQPAATVRDVGKGQAIYVGMLPGAEFYQILFDRLLPQARVDPLLPAAPPPGVEVAARYGPQGRFLFLLNHTDGSVTVQVPTMEESNGDQGTRAIALGPRQVHILHEG